MLLLQATSLWWLLCFLTILFTCNTYAELVVVSGPNANASFGTSNVLFVSVGYEYNITGVLVPVSFASGCKGADNQAFVPGANISFVVYSDAANAGCVSYEEIIFGVLLGLSTDAMVFVTAQNSLPGSFDNFGMTQTYANLGLAIAIVSTADGITLSQFISQATNNTLLVQVTADIGPFLRYLDTPPFVAYRVISSMIYYSLFLYCCYTQLIQFFERARYDMNLSNTLYLLILIFTLLRAIECSVDPLGYFTTMSIGARTGIWWTAYFFGLCAVCGLIIGWAEAVVSSHSLPRWSMKFLYIYMTVCVSVYTAMEISVIIKEIYAQSGIMGQVYVIMLYFLAVVVLPLACASCFFGIWLLLTLKRIAMTLEKRVLMIKITALMIVEVIALVGFFINNLMISLVFDTPELVMLVTYFELVFAVSMCVMILLTLRLKPYEKHTSAISPTTSGQDHNDNDYYSDLRAKNQNNRLSVDEIVLSLKPRNETLPDAEV